MQSTENTKVTLNEDIIISVPEGMIYTNPDEIDEEVKYMFVFYKDEQNEYYKKTHSKARYSFSKPADAPQCFTVNGVIGSCYYTNWDFSNPAMQEAFYNKFLRNSIMRKYPSIRVIDQSMIIYFARDDIDGNMFKYVIVTRKGIYPGHIWINDIADDRQRVATASSWIKAIEPLPKKESR